MDRRFRVITVLGLFFAILMVGVPFFGATPANAQESVEQTAPAPKAPPLLPAEVYQRLQERLDALEAGNPREQGSCFQIRELAEQLYRSSVPNPVDPQTPSGLLVPDLEHGRDLYAECQDLTDDALRAKLLAIMSASHAPIGYQTAQDVVFGKVDNQQGKVECVYTGKVIETQGEPSATIMNLEHTWPQSQGAVGIAKADVHHLFPTDSKANGIRGNLPFGLVPNPTWQQGGSKCGGGLFEVRPVHRGNVARAKFYFAVRYGKQIGSAEEAVLRAWHREDPVDSAEKDRNDRVENIQHNRNPFADHPEFVDQIKDF